MNPQSFCGKKHCFFVSPCWPLEYLGKGLLESVLEIYSCMWFLGQLKCQKLWFSPSKQYTKPKSQQFTVLNLSCISFFLVLSSLSFATSHPSNQLLAQTLLKPLKITITCLSAPAQCHPAQSSRNSWQMRNFPRSAAWVIRWVWTTFSKPFSRSPTAVRDSPLMCRLSPSAFSAIWKAASSDAFPSPKTR